MAQREPLTADQRNSFVAALLGWMMDAFDYFLVVLVYAEIAKEFGVSLTQMAFLTTATLVMRPVGAVIFGVWADRAGRRIPAGVGERLVERGQRGQRLGCRRGGSVVDRPDVGERQLGGGCQ